MTLNDREFLALNGLNFHLGLTSLLRRGFISTQIKTELGTKKENLQFGCLSYSRIRPNADSAPPCTQRQIKFSVGEAVGKPALFVET